MCGFVGTIGRPRGSREGVEDPIGAALAVLSPRGPDGAGRARGRLGPLAVEIGARRLALVDPTRGSQPIRRPSGALLAWNGEIYNHGALRARLVQRGEAFETLGDGEVLASLLDCEGEEGLARVEGSYAFAFLKGPEGPLLLGRDGAGVRPLVWAEADGTFVFASTVDALLATGLVEAEPDLEALADVLRDGVVSSGRTAVQGVHRVAPGEVLAIGRDLCPVPSRVPEPAPEDDGPYTVLDALRLAVADRLRLDRPAGIFLSGGVDSALVAALAREHGPLPAFTASFPGYGAVDEARRAQRTARRLQYEHVVVPCPRDPTPWVLGAARAFDEPFADASAVPTWGLAMAAGRRVRVALTGTGGDEVFGGYRRYWLLGTGPWLRFVPVTLRGIASALLGRATPDAARLLRASADPQGLYRGLLRLQPVSAVHALLGPRLLPLAIPAPETGPESAAQAMADDRRRYLPDDLLVKEDRALLAHGVEGRHPFLDRRVRRAAAAIEMTGRPGRGRQKQVLRAYVREMVDPDLSRSGKHGFSFPVDDLYRGPLRPLANDLLTSRRTRERGFVSADGTNRLLHDHVTGSRQAGAAIHALVMIELWARRVLDGDAPYSL